MLVSVVIPTYRRGKYIAKAIDSVLSQTYNNLEIIIIDDNISNSIEREQTQKIIEDINDSRILYIQNAKNLGGSLSRNVGIFKAKGEYITFLDDDDLYLPKKIEVQLSFMIKHGLNVCVMDGATYSYKKGNLISKKQQYIKKGMTNEELIKAHLLYHISGTNTFMYKTSFLKEIGGFVDIPSCQEYMLMLKTLNKNPKFGYIPKVLVKNYNHDEEQLSTGQKKIKGQMILIQKKKEYFHLLSTSEKRYVMCRHHGVLFFVHHKMKNRFLALKEAILCFISSPKQALKWYQEYKGKIN